MEDEIKWVKIFNSPSRLEVSLVKGLLHEQEIVAVEVNQKDTMYGTFGEIHLSVPEDRVEEARAVVADYKANKSSEDE